MQLVSDKVKQIAQNPYVYKPSDYKDTRVASLSNFSIYYKVTIERIIILAF